MIALGSISVSPFDAGWLSAALVLATPVLLAAIGELISERAGVLNVGLEGMMVSGAFVAYYATDKLHSIALGACLGVCGGMVFGLVMGLLAIEARADQVVAGVGVNLMALGITSYLFEQIYGGEAEVVVKTTGNVRIPLLADIPGVGTALFDQDVFVYLALLLVPACWFLLYRTRWGLEIRACGEHPAAADTAGVSVRRVRWGALMAASGLAGLGGAYLIVGSAGIFADDVPSGRGYLALIAVIFGRWRPVGTLAACLLFGAADALQIRLTLLSHIPRIVWIVVAFVGIVVLIRLLVLHRGHIDRSGNRVATAVALVGLALAIITPAISLPAQFWRSLPYLIGLLALASAVTRARMPGALTYPYRRGEG